MVYGTLADAELKGIDGIKIRWENKSLRGFTLFEWLSTLTPEQIKKHKEFIAKNIKTVFKTDIAKCYPFEDLKPAFEHFS